MIAARFATECPGCSNQIQPGDSIDCIGLSYYCELCVRDFERENRQAPRPAVATYPVSSMFEAQ